MPDLLAISELLLAISETHAGLSELYSQLALHHTDPSTSIAVKTLARAIQGEEAGVFGEERETLAIWIVHTAINRYDKPWWKRIGGVDCTFSARVEYDWHGTKNVRLEDVEPWALHIAHQVLEERRAGGIDYANGALFAMTLADLESHGWLERARELVVNVIVSPDDPLVQFWFLSDDPGKESK